MGPREKHPKKTKTKFVIVLGGNLKLGGDFLPPKGLKKKEKKNTADCLHHTVQVAGVEIVVHNKLLIQALNNMLACMFFALDIGDANRVNGQWFTKLKQQMLIMREVC